MLIHLQWAPVGIAAAIGVIDHFAAAIVAHLCSGDAQHLGTPLATLVIAVIALASQVAST